MMSGSALPWSKLPSEQEGGDSWGPSGPAQWLVSQLMIVSGHWLQDTQSGCHSRVFDLNLLCKG